MAAPQKVSFLGGTPLTQEPASPPGEAEEAPKTAADQAFEDAERAQTVARTVDAIMGATQEDEDFEVPKLRRRSAAKSKVDMYIDAQLARDLDDLCRFARYQFDARKGEVQELVVRYGLNNKAEIMRALRASVAEDE